MIKHFPLLFIHSSFSWPSHLLPEVSHLPSLLVFVYISLFSALSLNGKDPFIAFLSSKEFFLTFYSFSIILWIIKTSSLYVCIVWSRLPPLQDHSCRRSDCRARRRLPASNCCTAIGPHRYYVIQHRYLTSIMWSGLVWRVCLPSHHSLLPRAQKGWFYPGIWFSTYFTTRLCPSTSFTHTKNRQGRRKNPHENTLFFEKSNKFKLKPFSI